MRFAFACTMMFGLPLLLISLAPFVDAASDAGMFATELSKNGGKELSLESDLRFSLWAQAIQVGINTSMLGLGTSSILSRVRRPISKPIIPFLIYSLRED